MINNEKYKDWFIGKNELPKPLSKEELYILFESMNNGSKKAREKIMSQ